MPLPEPVTESGSQGLRAILAVPSRALVAVDFDGTLSPIVADPASARPHELAPGTLRRLARCFGTVAVVSGRPAASAAALLGFTGDPPPPNVVVVGHYGLETWTAAAGVVRLVGEPGVEAGEIDAVRAALPALLGALDLPTGITIEDKGVAVAVHVRNTGDPAAALAAVREPLAALAAAHGLRLEPGRMVLELRPAGTDKGCAVDALVRDHGAQAVGYIGDDLGDLAAFDALDRLRLRGVPALAVCSGSAEAPELAERADLVLDGPDGVVAFLAELVGAVRR